MSWTQLGLALSMPKKLSPKAKLSASKPIKKTKLERGVKLKPGELDDPIDDLF